LTEALAVPNDAKLGLVAGVALVIVVAVLYFHNDLGAGKTPGDAAAATVVGPAAPVRGSGRDAGGKTMSLGTSDETRVNTAQMPKAEDEPRP
jgi:hypothetical protein